MPYSSILTLGYSLSELAERDEDEIVSEVLEQAEDAFQGLGWYWEWCSIVCQAYNPSVEEMLIEELPEVTFESMSLWKIQ